MTDKNKDFVDWHIAIAEMKANIPRMKEMMVLMIEQYPLYAKQYKVYFDALITEGFKPEQAIDIIKAQGWLPK